MAVYPEPPAAYPRNDRLAALARLSTLLRSTSAARDAARITIDAMPEIFPADAWAIWRYDEREGLWHILASAGLSSAYAEQTVPGRRDGALDDGPFFVEDIHANPVTAEREQFHESEGIVAMFVIPLHIRGAMSGTLICYHRTRRQPAEDDRLIGSLVADIVSVALGTSRFERLAEAARVVSAELDVHRLVQEVTDVATELTHAQFGAFFYNVLDERGGSYTLYTISGVPRSHFERFPMPRNTAVFEPTFSGTGVVRSANIRRDPRYGKNAPYHGMPEGHLPVVSYLAVPVVSRNGMVLGGLFFGHSDEGVFTENEEQVAVALAAQAAVGIDNARLYDALQRERELLLRNEARYRGLVMSSPSQQAIWITDAEGQLLDDNDSWSALTGQAVDELRGDGWAEAVHPDDRPATVAAWQEAVRTRGTYKSEMRVRLRDGSYRWFRATGIPVTAPDGRILEWVGTSIDIQDERISEQGTRLLARASEIFGASLDYEKTLETVANLAVPQLADWCAIDLVEEDGITVKRLAVAHKDPEKVAFAHAIRRRYPPSPENDILATVIRSGEKVFVPYLPEGTLEAAARDAEHLEILRALNVMSYMVLPLRARGHILGTISFVSSDSWRRFTEADLELAEEFARRAAWSIDNARLYRDAQAANKTKDEFLATLSHELRTPMTAVVGWARMLKLGLEPHEAVEAVDAIEKSAAIQAQLIEDILDMSRIMAGKLRIEMTPFDLQTATNNALAAVHPQAAGKGVELLTRFAPEAATVMGDEGRLQQVVWNLLTNAIKFTPKGGRVEVRVETDGGAVQLSVRDSGAGIDPSFLPHVFEPFRQQDSSTTRAHGGIGLGLAIVRHLVELHGGTIRAQSEGNGTGALFTVELPRLDRPGRGRMAAGSSASTLVPLDGLRLLVIDDQPDTRDILAAILRRCRAEVTTAESARQGLERVAAHPFDAIVCDIAMPHEDGYSFVRALRALDSPAARLPVIAATAFGRPEDRENALRHGFNAYLKKPIEPGVLSATIRELAKS